MARMRLADLEVTHRFATVNGLGYHYVEKGAGPLVLLLHGFPECWWSWRYQLDALAEAGFRVVAPDQRGYNDTDKQGPYDLDTLAGDIVALLRELGVGRAHVVGHDWGGGVAWHLATYHPETVERLCILNMPHPGKLREAFITRPRPRQLRRSWYVFFFQLPFLPEWALTRNDAEAIARMYRASAVDHSRFGDDEIRPFRDAIQKDGAAEAMVGWYRAAIRRAFRTLRRPLPQVESPTLLLWAMDDLALGFDDLVPGTDRFVKNLRVERIERCGHFLQAEQPELVNQYLIDFLAG